MLEVRRLVTVPWLRVWFRSAQHAERYSGLRCLVLLNPATIEPGSRVRWLQDPLPTCPNPSGRVTGRTDRLDVKLIAGNVANEVDRSGLVAYWDKTLDETGTARRET